MSRFEIQLATALMLLISSGSAGAQDLSGQCDKTSTPCSLPSSGQDPLPQVTATNQQVNVTFDGKVLSVQAHGASLRSVLAAIGKRTGTEIEFGIGSDPGGVYVDLGPATVRDLLRDLLNGSQLNYVMFRSRSDPGYVERLVILGNEGAPASADHSPPAVVATGQSAPPQAYGTVFATDHAEGNVSHSVSAIAKPEPAPAAVAVQPSDVLVKPEPAPAVADQPSAVQPSDDPSMQKYQQLYQQAIADAASSGKSQGQILGEIQKILQKDLNDQYSQSQPH